MAIVKNKIKGSALFFLGYLICSSALFANFESRPILEDPLESYSQGWSIDLAGRYDWASLTTPPTYSGNAAGLSSKLTYEKSDHFFSQLRVHYDHDISPLKSNQNSIKTNEWRTEVTAGYSFPIKDGWSVTPYLGIGLDWLKAQHSSYSSVPSIKLTYETHYALIGCNACYKSQKWSFAGQIECLPVLRQYLRVDSLSWSSWRLKQKTGMNILFPMEYLLKDNLCLEITPYYRWFFIGASDEMGLPQRNLTQYGVSLGFRYFF